MVLRSGKTIPSIEGPRCSIDRAWWGGTRNISRSGNEKDGERKGEVDFRIALVNRGLTFCYLHRLRPSLRRAYSLFNLLVVIFETHNVVLAQIVAKLNFDDGQAAFAVVSQAMIGFGRDVDMLALLKL